MKRFVSIYLLLLLLVLFIVPKNYAKEVGYDRELLKTKLSTITRQMIIEILLDERKDLKQPVILENEIRMVLDSRFRGDDIPNKKEIRVKILADLDDLYAKERLEFDELTETETLYYIVLSLLANRNGSYNYMAILEYCYEDCYGYDNKHQYINMFDSYLVYLMVDLYIKNENDNFDKKSCVIGIRHYLKELNKLIEYSSVKTRFPKYQKELGQILDEIVDNPYLYQVKQGDGYLVLARYVWERSGLNNKNKHYKQVINELAEEIKSDLNSKGIYGIQPGQTIRLYYVTYYLSGLLVERFD